MSSEHKIKQGECIDSLAKRYGFFPDTIWNHADNAEIKELRGDPNILESGDIVVIPDKTLGKESCATEQTHVFVHRGVPAKLRLVFYKPVEPEEEVDADDQGGDSGSDASDESTYEEEPPVEVEEQEPIADAPYRINIDGETTEGQSDSEGMVDVPLRPGAKRATLTFYPDTDDAIDFDLDLGKMDPVQTPSGVRKRLFNLGYRCVPEGKELDDDLKAALRQFQGEHELKISGEIDLTTKDKLVEVHGS